MPMILRSDIAKACRDAGTGKPVDLAHLSTQTMGDRDLEREVLFIFVNQSSIYLKMFQIAASAQDRRRAAHSLKGAARGIGAWTLAELASEAEMPGADNGDELACEIARVCDYIRSLYKDQGA